MYTGYSSVTTSDIPASAPVVFAYADGEWSQVEEVKRRCPHAKIVTIHCLTRYGADMYDFEPGCLPVAEAHTILLDVIKGGQKSPIGYASLDNMLTIRSEFEKSGGNVNEVRWLPAHYTPTPELPEWAAGVQWSETALGRNLNEYLIRSDFFGGGVPAPDKVKSYALEVNYTTEKVTIK